MVILNKLTKYVITRFVPKEAEIERIPSGRFREVPFVELKKAREPSEFEGKTIAIETSGILYDRKELKKLIDEIISEIPCMVGFSLNQIEQVLKNYPCRFEFKNELMKLKMEVDLAE